MDRYEHSDQWPAFIVPWDDTKSTITDMSFLLHKPAGKYGFIQSSDGHFVTGDQKRFKIWGQNMTLSAPMPPSEEASILAKRMAKYAINCIRLHHIDHRWPEGILMRHSTGTPAPIGRDLGAPNDGRGESTRALDPEALTRLDWFIYCCKQEGIYIDLNLHVSRQFTQADGIRDADLTGFGKAVTYFNRDMIALQKEYARQLLTHVNPFTGNDYAHEPCVALIELLNENGLQSFWMRDKLDGNTALGETWGSIPLSYAQELDGMYNEYLKGLYPTRKALSEAWGKELGEDENHLNGTVRRTINSKAADTKARRFMDEAAFYLSVEISYFNEMQAYLREELDARQLIVGTSDCSYGDGGLGQAQALSQCDVMDGHAYYNSYWDTPDLRRNKRSAREWYKDWRLNDTAMVEDPATSLPAKLGRTIVKGLPYIVSEINEHFPGNYACECFPVNTAYALLQDWDGIFWFGYAGTDWEGVFNFDENLPIQTKLLKTQAITRFEWMCNDPMKMLQSALCAMMYLRGDVDMAGEIISRHHSREDVLSDSRHVNGSSYYGMNDFSSLNALVHRVQVADFQSEERRIQGPVETAFGREIVSDTKQISWLAEGKKSLVKVSAPRHIIVTGFAPKVSDPRFTIESDMDFASIHVASVDGLELERSGKMLILACSRVANTGMVCKKDVCSLGDQFGGPPTRVEPVACLIRLSGLEKNAAYILTPLDGTGSPLQKGARLTAKENSLEIQLSEAGQTIIYSLVKED